MHDATDVLFQLMLAHLIILFPHLLSSITPMTSLANRVLYGRGLNIAAQINPSRRSLTTFAPIEEMRGAQIKKLGCGFLQSYYLLQDGSFVKSGYFMDSLTSIRIFNLHRLAPFLIPIMQRAFFLGTLLSFRGGDPVPTLFNKDVGSPFKDVVFGGCRVFGITQSKQVYAMGENYFAQLGTRNTMNYEGIFVKIEDINKERIVKVGCGFQHTLFFTDNDNLYGCGKASEYQIQPIRYREKDQVADKIEQPQAIMKGEKVIKATGGLKFTLIWTDKNKLYAVGSNRFGQCGQNNIRFPQLKQPTRIDFEWEKDEEVLDIASGFCHSLVLTNKYVYFLGSIEQGQNPFASFNENLCTPTILPINRPIKIFANFDRSAIIDAQGYLHLFGGKDYSYCGGESGQLQRVQGFGARSEVGLGFGHTLLYP